MTPFLRSHLLAEAGFPHGFGTRDALPPSPCFTLRQVHGERIVTLPQAPLFDPWKFDQGDALLSLVPGTVVGVRTADCLPILLAHPGTGAVAAVHCGWRSTALGLAGKAARALARAAGGEVEELLAAVGPCIGPCCYAVGDEVREGMRGHAGEKALAETEGRLTLDLARANQLDLLAAGLPPQRMERVSGCTSCRPDLFFSWRGERTEKRLTNWVGTFLLYYR